MTSLQAAIRTDNGKGEARKLRATGRIPGVLYGPDHEPVTLSVDPDALTEIFKQTQDRNTIVQLQVEGDTVPTLVREVQRHPLTRELLHADFYRVSMERPVEVMVPLRPVGRPRGAVLGGRTRLIRRELRARCRYDRIPVDLPVDVTPMQIGDMVKVSQVKVPEGVELVYDHDFNVVTVYGKRGARVAAEEEEAPAAEGGEEEEAAAEGAEATE